jgi:hypothetical protein
VGDSAVYGFASMTLEQWYLYDHNFQSKFAAKITDPRAPALTKDSRYFLKLGAYMPIKVGSSKVICLKSNLHLATDGPAIPLLLLWQQIAEEVQPKLIITTGTAGAIGPTIKLLDGLVASFTIRDGLIETPSRRMVARTYIAILEMLRRYISIRLD